MVVIWKINVFINSFWLYLTFGTVFWSKKLKKLRFKGPSIYYKVIKIWGFLNLLRTANLIWVSHQRENCYMALMLVHVNNMKLELLIHGKILNQTAFLTLSPLCTSMLPEEGRAEATDLKASQGCLVLQPWFVWSLVHCCLPVTGL